MKQAIHNALQCIALFNSINSVKKYVFQGSGDEKRMEIRVGLFWSDIHKPRARVEYCGRCSWDKSSRVGLDNVSALF